MAPGPVCTGDPWEAGTLESNRDMTIGLGERQGCVSSVSYFSFKTETLILVLFIIPDNFEPCCKLIKNGFLGHNDILPINCKNLIRLQRHSCDSTECVHGPLPWTDAENSHVNQFEIDESM